MQKEQINRISNKIIGSAIKVHKTLGPGFIEKLYERALEDEFKKQEFRFQRQKEIKVEYNNVFIGDQRVDFLVEDEIIVELKAVSEINGIHKAQILSYLKAADKRLRLILNFAKRRLEIKRIANNL